MGLEVRSLCVSRGGRPILDHISLEVPTGSTVAILGPSGAGKSTLLRAIVGIIRPDAGSVLLDGIDITDRAIHKRKVGFVFQDDQLFAHLNVADNIGFGLDVEGPIAAPGRRRIHREAKEQRIREMLTLVGLSGFESRHIGNLSGGESKRVALARALAPSPSVLLLDEPLTGLDRDLHDRLMSDVKEILRSTRTTCVLVTHDAHEAEYLASFTISMTAPPPREQTDRAH